MKIKIKYFYLFIIATFAVISCEDNNSVFDPDFELTGETPVINSRYLAGVDSVIINGSFFSSNIEENTVNFGGSPGVILQASENQLIVRPGFNTGDSILVRVSTRGTEFFNDDYYYRLDSAFTNVRGLDNNYRPLSALAIDKDENLHGFINIAGTKAFYQITKSGVISTYSPTTRFGTYTGAQFGPDDGLYLISTASPNSAIFRMPSGGNAQGQQDGVWAFPPFSEKANFVDLAFDNNGYIWVIGNNTNIYRYTYSDKSLQRFPFTANLRTAVVFNNQLFVAGSKDNIETVWKFDISGSSLGAPSEVLRLENNTTSEINGVIRDISFDSDGNLYLAIQNGNNSILKVEPNGRIYPFYRYVLEGSYYSLTWDEEGNMIGGILSGENGSLLLNKIDMFDNTRAPIYGIE